MSQAGAGDPHECISWIDTRLPKLAGHDVRVREVNGEILVDMCLVTFTKDQLIEYVEFFREKRGIEDCSLRITNEDGVEHETRYDVFHDAFRTFGGRQDADEFFNLIDRLIEKLWKK
jgi:hypothetical protein